MFPRKTNRAKTTAPVGFVVPAAFDAESMVVRPPHFGFISSNFMVRHMFSSCCDGEIFKSVVNFVFINMVNNFGPDERPANMLLHKPSMKVNLFSKRKSNTVITTSFIKVWFRRPIFNYIAFVATLAFTKWSKAFFTIINHKSIILYHRAIYNRSE